jgi:hypothetical protein
MMLHPTHTFDGRVYISLVSHVLIEFEEKERNTCHPVVYACRCLPDQAFSVCGIERHRLPGHAVRMVVSLGEQFVTNAHNFIDYLGTPGVILPFA